MTNDRKARILQALSETVEAWERAMRYSPEHRDYDLIRDYEDHMEQLIKALDEPLDDFNYVGSHHHY